MVLLPEISREIFLPPNEIIGIPAGFPAGTEVNPPVGTGKFRKASPAGIIAAECKKDLLFIGIFMINIYLRDFSSFRFHIV